MGRLAVRTVAELARGWVLAPERYDPAGRLEGERRLGDLVRVNVPARRPAELPAGPLLVLETGHAADGFVYPPATLTTATACLSSKRALQPGDVLVSRLRPYLRQVAWVDPALFRIAPEGNAVVASPEFLVLRAPAGFDGASLVPWLVSPAVQQVLVAAQEGGHHPRVPTEALLALGVPGSVLRAGPAVGAKWRAATADLRRALATAAALVAGVGADQA